MHDEPIDHDRVSEDQLAARGAYTHAGAARHLAVALGDPSPESLHRMLDAAVAQALRVALLLEYRGELDLPAEETVAARAHSLADGLSLAATLAELDAAVGASPC